MAKTIDTAIAESQDFRDIDNLAPKEQLRTEQGPAVGMVNEQALWIAEKLDNNKWACNHKCKDKSA